MRDLILTVLCVGSLLCPVQSAEAQDVPRIPAPRLRGPVPVITLPVDRFVSTEQEQAEISQLIDRLAEIDSPDMGLSPTLSGTNFAPVEGATQASTLLLVQNHGVRTNESLRKLVAHGPRALPQLLERLTDATPTKLLIEPGAIASLFTGKEVVLNPVNEHETQLRRQYPDYFLPREDPRARPPAIDLQQKLSSHRITIGDVCFVIVGQIENRRYSASRYQPSGLVFINSPTLDPKIGEAVRGVWQSAHPEQHLLNSLLIDEHTEQLPSALTGLNRGATLRLLHYFPDETAPRMSGRIRSFDVSRPKTDEESSKLHERNGGDVSTVLQLVRSSAHPEIVAALRDVVARTDDPSVLLAALTPEVMQQERQIILEKTRRILAQRPTVDTGPYSPEHGFLQAAAREYPDEARELFEQYRNHRHTNAYRVTISALTKPTQPRRWMIQFLGEMLGNAGPSNTETDEKSGSQPLRICDEAARVLTTDYLKEIAFNVNTGRSQRDAQIRNLKSAIARLPAENPAAPGKP